MLLIQKTFYENVLLYDSRLIKMKNYVSASFVQAQFETVLHILVLMQPLPSKLKIKVYFFLHEITFS